MDFLKSTFKDTIDTAITKHVKVPLQAKKNIKDASAKNEGYLKEINTLLGTKWTLDVDYTQIYETIISNDHDKSFEKNFGSITNDYFKSFVSNLKNFLKKDEDYKDALVEEITAKKIVFKIVDPKSSDEFSYCKATVEDGAVVFNVKKGEFGTNSANMGHDLESQL